MVTTPRQPVQISTEPAENIDIESNVWSTTTPNGLSQTPQPVPSPSRYGAIAALDEGYEIREVERWAERTETITRMEHEM